MNAMQARGQWNLMKGGFKMRFSKMTHNTMGRMSGRMLCMKGGAQKRYGRLTETTGKQFKRLTRH